jgi:hypothetical protein
MLLVELRVHRNCGREHWYGARSTRVLGCATLQHVFLAILSAKFAFLGVVQSKSEPQSVYPGSRVPNNTQWRKSQHRNNRVDKRQSAEKDVSSAFRGYIVPSIGLVPGVFG